MDGTYLSNLTSRNNNRPVRNKQLVCLWNECVHADFLFSVGNANNNTDYVMMIIWHQAPPTSQLAVCGGWGGGWRPIVARRTFRRNAHCYERSANALTMCWGTCARANLTNRPAIVQYARRTKQLTSAASALESSMQSRGATAAMVKSPAGASQMKCIMSSKPADPARLAPALGKLPGMLPLGWDARLHLKLLVLLPATRAPQLLGLMLRLRWLMLRCIDAVRWALVVAPLAMMGKAPPLLPAKLVSALKHGAEVA